MTEPSKGIGCTYGWPWDALGLYPDEPWRYPGRPVVFAIAALAVLLELGLLLLCFVLIVSLPFVG